jgi:DNA polymerase III epsilon subunit-like protein
MKLLVFDTETTGKPPKVPVLKETVGLWPYIVQLSFLLFDTETYKYQQFDHVIKVPDEIEIVQEVVAIHGITKGRNRKIGYSFTDIYKIFEVCEQSCDLIVAHNANFDLNMLRAECLRNAIPFTVTRPTYCTMWATTRMCKLHKPSNINPLSKDYKWPSLKELHFFLFQEEATGLHNSLIDVIVCLRCYMKVMHKVDICEKVKKLKCI